MPVTREDGTPWTRRDYEKAQAFLEDQSLAAPVRSKLERKVQDFANETLQKTETAGPEGLEAFERAAPPAAEEPEPVVQVPNIADDDADLPPHLRLNPALPNSSKRKDLYRNPQVAGQPGDFWAAIPSILPGGKLKFYAEPPVERFREEMAPVLRARGLNPDQLDETSDEYKEYADRKWMQIHDMAKAKGEAVLRHSKMKESLGTPEGWAKLATEGYGKLGAFADGMLSGLVPGASEAVAATGLPGDVESLRATRLAPSGYAGGVGNEHFHTAGLVAGAVNPLGLGVRALSAAYKYLAPIGSGLLRRSLAAGAAAGSVGALEGAANDAAAAGADAAAGAPVAPVDVGEMGERGLGRFALGAGLGAVGEPIATGARGLVRNLRRGPLRDELPAAEAAGVETDAIRGLKLPAYAEENLDTAVSRATDPASTVGGNPVDIAVEKVRGPVAKTATDLEKRTRDSVAARSQRYYDTPEGQEQVETAELADRLADIVAGRSKDATGAPLPWRNNTALLQKARDLWEPPQVLPITKVPPGSKTVSVDEAERMGLSVGDVSPMLRKAGVVVLKPKTLNARELDDVIEAIDQAAKAGKRTEGDDPAYSALQEAARRVRERFKPNEAAPEGLTADIDGRQVKGWAALKHQQGRELGELEQTLGHAGVRSAKPFEAMRADDQKALNSAVRAYKDGSDAQRDAALMKLANLGGFRELLEQVSGTRLGISLRDKVSLGGMIRGAVGVGGPSAYLGGISGSARLRLDPATRALGESMPARLKEVLRGMRRPAVGRLSDVAALGGGGLGRSVGAGAAESDDPGGLTNEDYENLQKLLEVYDADTGKEKATLEYERRQRAQENQQ